VVRVVVMLQPGPGAAPEESPRPVRHRDGFGLGLPQTEAGLGAASPAAPGRHRLDSVAEME